MTQAGAGADLAGAGAPLGVLQIGAAQLALPLGVLGEAVVCPQRLEGLPVEAQGLVGALSVRDRIVAVLDVRYALGLPHERHDGQVVVVIRHRDRMLGLLADGVRGFTRAREGDLQPVDNAVSTLLFRAWFRRAEDGSIVSLLDPDALLSLPGVPLACEAGGVPLGQARGDAARGRLHGLMQVRCGARVLAVPILDVHATLPPVPVERSALAHGPCRGTLAYRDRPVPAVDLLSLLGMGELPRDAMHPALVLRVGDGLVALLVGRVDDIVHVRDDALLAPPAPLLPGAEYIGACLDVQGLGEVPVLAAGALQRDPTLAALATFASERESGQHRAKAPQTALGAAPVITYDIGAELASRLADVREVLALPEGHAHRGGGHAAAMGTLLHRGHSVVLLCLASLLGHARGHPRRGFVLLVESAEARFGFVVTGLRGIERPSWEAPHASPALPGSPARGGRPGLVEVGGADQRRVCPLIDLRSLAGQLAAAHAVLA